MICLAALERRMALGAGHQRGAAERYARVDGAVVADHGRFADHDAKAVVDEDPAADDRTGMDLDAGDDARDIGEKAAEPLQVEAPARMRPAVHDDRVQAGIAGEHFPAVTRGRVAFDDALDIFAQRGKHNGDRRRTGTNGSLSGGRLLGRGAIWRGYCRSSRSDDRTERGRQAWVCWTADFRGRLRKSAFSRFERGLNA